MGSGTSPVRRRWVVGPPRFEILAPQGPLARGPEAQSRRTSEKKCLALGFRAFGGSLGGGAHEPPCRVSGPWDVSEKIPLAIYLNGFGLAVSWTRLGRVRLSRIQNLCLKGTPTTGRKSLVTLRPSLGVKRSEKWRAHVRIFLEYEH